MKSNPPSAKVSTNSRGSLRRLCSLSAFVLLAFVVFSCSVTSQLHADEPKFKVGDNVRFEYHGKECEGKVTEVLNNGWPRVSFEFNGRTTNHLFASNRVSQSEKAKDSGSLATKLTTEMRTWKDATGSFEVEAKLVGMEGDSLKLKNVDGKSITVPIAKLSKEDKDFVTKLIADAKVEKDNPFAVDSEGPMEKADAEPKKSALIEPSLPDESAARIITVGTGDGGDWGIEPDAADTGSLQWLDAMKIGTLPVSSQSNSVHDRHSALLIARDVGVAAISASNPFDQHSEVNIVDLGDRTRQSQFELPYKDGKAIAISPSADKIVTLKPGQSRNPGRIDFWTTNFAGENSDEKSGATNSKTWKAADFFGKGGVIASDAEFISDNLLLTTGKKVSLWDIEKESAIYSATWQIAPKTRISPNRKYLAFFSGETIGVLNVADGKVLGTAKSPARTISSLAFSPSGEFLAGYGVGSIYIWSLSDGSLIREMSLSQSSARSGGFEWPDEQHLLINGSQLVNIPLRVVVWKYNRAGAWASVRHVASDRFVYTARQKDNNHLTPIKIPHQPMDDLTADLIADDLLVVKPGVSVSVNIDLPLAPDEQKRIRESVFAQLEAAGIVVDSGADLVVRISVEKREKKTMNLRSIGGRFGRRGTTEVPYTPTTSRVELLRGKDVLWSQSAQNEPGSMIRTGEGETAEDVIKRQCQPRPEFFASVVLPRFLAVLPGGKGSLGTSKVTPTGIE